MSAGAVVEPVDVRDQVVPGVVLALLLEAAVQVAAVHVGALHLLAVQLGDDLDGAVRGRMRRADVDDDRVVALAAFEGSGRTGLGKLGVRRPSAHVAVRHERLLALFG